MISQLINIILSAYLHILEYFLFSGHSTPTPVECISLTHVSLLSLEPGKELEMLKEILQLFYGQVILVITQSNAATYQDGYFD